MLRRSLSSLIPHPALVNIVQGTWVLDGTTNTLSRTIASSAIGQPISGVKPTAASSSLSATGGLRHFTLIGGDLYVNGVHA
jgi:hypothetical protein